MTKQLYPEVTCGALIFGPDKKIFLMKSYKWRDKYVIPGGHVELGEKLEEALRREIKEETGLKIHDIEFLILQEFIFGDAFWKRKHFIFLNYTCKTDSFEVRLSSEGQEYVWVSLKEALKLSLEPYARRAIEKYLEKAATTK